MAQLLIDDNAITNFIDDLNVQCFVDNLGNFTLCPDAVTTITRGKSPQRGHTYVQSDWYLIR